MGRSVDTRRLILSSAVTVIGTKGYAETSVDEIAAHAGLSKGILYYHFDSKAEIATKILNEGINAISDACEAISKEEPEAHVALERMTNWFIDCIFSNREFGRFLLSEFGRAGRPWSEALLEPEKRLMDVIAAEIQRSQEQGKTRQGIDTQFAAVSILGIVLTTCMYYIVGADSMEKDALSNHLCDLIAAALAQ